MYSHSLVLLRKGDILGLCIIHMQVFLMCTCLLTCLLLDVDSVALVAAVGPSDIPT